MSGVWLVLAATAAFLAAIGSVVGFLMDDAVYGKETALLADAVAAQDLVNLMLVAPLLVILGWRAYRGHLGAYLCWLGCLLFTVYNYAIYSFDIQFGPLFLLWVAVLGLSTFALLGALATTDTRAVKARFDGRRMRWSGCFLVGVAALFALLWLSEIIPALWSGSGSRSADEWNVPTSPLHVLDLALFLPAAAVSGWLLLRRRPLGYTIAAGQLTWVALTCLPILVTPVVAQARGQQPGWAVTAPIAVILLVTLATLGRMLRDFHSSPRGTHTRPAPPGRREATERELPRR